MNLGEKLRELRHGKNLTQPELAEAMGIEQSYLSKIETGKCLPSADVFDRILETFGVPVGDLVDDLDVPVRNRLRQIPLVAQHFNEQKRLLIGDRRRWLLVSTVFVAIGFAVAYAGHTNVFVPDTVYNYYSECLLPGDTPPERFRCENNADGSLAGMEFRTARGYRGERYVESVEGGFRSYTIGMTREVSPWQNKVIAAFGVLFAVLGVTGLAMEKKLTSFQ